MTSTNLTDLDLIDVTTLECVYTCDGWCGGPRYGMVYDLGRGRGYLAGYRSKAWPGLGLMGRQHFASLAKAKDYAVSCNQGS